jgi:hypothetical protein
MLLPKAFQQMHKAKEFHTLRSIHEASQLPGHVLPRYKHDEQLVAPSVQSALIHPF